MCAPVEYCMQVICDSPINVNWLLKSTVYMTGVNVRYYSMLSSLLSINQNVTVC